MNKGSSQTQNSAENGSKPKSNDAKSLLRAAQIVQPELMAATAWISKNGGDPVAVVESVLLYLRSKNRHLPFAQRRRYAARAVIGEFLAGWGAKNKGKTVRNMLGDPTDGDEVRSFQMVLLAAGDARAFERVVGKLARVNKVGGMVGDAENFSAFLASNDLTMASRFLRNFNMTVEGAARKSLNYIEKMAVSHYLQERAETARDDSGLAKHLARSKKLSTRTKIAAKLVYMPALLNQAERDELRDKYAVKGSLSARLMVKDVAKLLGFKNAAALSRKLYRLREWAPKDYVVDQTEVKY